MKYLALALLFFFQQLFAQDASLNIIPQPVKVQRLTGDFKLSRNTVIATRNEEDKKAARFLNDYLKEVYGFTLDIDKQEGKDFIRLNTKTFIKAPEKDAYTLQVTKDGVTIEGDTHAGTFYGMQTLIQLLAPYDVKPALGKDVSISSLLIPFVNIEDYPRFNYRGMHLDVTRHFFPVSFVKKYIDYLSLHKMNYFHWHLTDDQGWRIEIKKYPRLTEVGAYRNGTTIGRYPGTGNDNQRYGGFYTQEEIKDVVQYAADRHITVVPEVEMPGHASAAIAAYPFLSCFPEQPTKFPTTASDKSIALQAAGEKKLVQETWGIFPDVFCAGKDSTFLFLQNVMDEVLTLFPSTYIHLGGDECPKTHWKKCPDCQARIKKEGLKNEHELQSYFVQRMEKYLNAKGRTLIGWDEILEGGLAPNAVVMSWRGEKGGIEAAKQKHYVIMTPQKPMYFDHTQSESEDSVTIGGFNPIESVYAYDPIPQELNEDAAKYILGAQANLWTEYIKNTRKVEYMIFPRMSALSEVLWSPKESRNWNDFEKRLATQFQRYELWGANHSNAYYDLKASITPAANKNGLEWKLTTRQKNAVIKYTDGTKKILSTYKAPLRIEQSNTYTVQAFKNNKLVSTLTQKFNFSKSTGKKITLNETPSKAYPGDGAFTLVNGVINEKALARSKEFLGFQTNVEAVIDLGKKETLKEALVHVLVQTPSWIYQPKYVQVFLSQDGKTYKEAGMTDDLIKGIDKKGMYRVALKNQQARFVKLVAASWGEIADGSPGAGNKAWLFLDEIQIF